MIQLWHAQWARLHMRRLQCHCRTAGPTGRRLHPQFLTVCRSVHSQGHSSESVLEHIAAEQEAAAARPHRFYVPQRLDQSIQGNQILLDGEEGRHAIRSLRLKEGNLVQLCDGLGTLLTCTLTTVDKGRNRAWCEVTSTAQTAHWEGPSWCLAVACTTLKGGRAEWLVEKATELGARELIPVITARSQPSRVSGGNKYRRAQGNESNSDDNDSSGDYQPSRMERIAIAATKQCLRAHMLKLHAPTPVQQVAEMISESEMALLAVGGAPTLYDVLCQNVDKAQNSTGHNMLQDSGNDITKHRKMLLVGPEGDWTPDELQLLVAAGALPVGLGNLRLRTETAAIAMLSAASLWHRL